MNIEVQKFLNDSAANFSESSPRPPVPGEENELASNGGTSTRSSGSHKSHLSTKSHTSSKSGRNEHSPAATPRRSNLEKTGKFVGFSGHGDGHDLEAPLGFEPEGSAANSPPFTENSSPPYLKWAESIHFLLEDSDGIRLFNQFLEQEQCSNLLSFYFACRGFKLVPPDDKLKATNLARLIYRKYIKGEALKLLPDTKREIADKIKQELVDQHLLDRAQQEVYNSMQTDTYPLFLKSDLYVEYVRNGGESPKTTSNTSSGSNSVLPAVGPLPTLQEGEELRSEDLDKTQDSGSSATLILTQESLRATRYTRSAMQKRRPEGLFLQPSKKRSNQIYHHISYAPTSAQDSELQSLSSDALTDDTISLTDSSVDGRDGGKKWSKPHRKAVHRARVNQNAELSTHFIPRTERAPKGCNLAETDAKAFAAMLIERLERVIKEREKMEKVKESMHSLDMTEEEELKLTDVSMVPTNGPNVSAIGPLGALMATAMAEQEDDNAQSILEDHVSRVWDNSAGQTPSRSPGRSPSLHRRGGPVQLTGPPTNVSASNLLSRSLPHHPPTHKRKDKDLHFSTSMLSFDSGVGGEDKSSAVHMDPDSSIYRHHHHYHHHKSSSRPQFMDIDTPRRPLQYHVSDSSVRDSNTSWEDPNRSRSKDTTKRLNAKKTTSDCNIDSGVSLYDASPVSVPNLHDPNSEKVMQWMLENEKMGPSNTQYSTDNSDKSSSHKRSHKSTTNSASRSRKPQGQYHSSSRSASLDRSYQSVDYHTAHLSHVQPAQPFIQDPSMPLLNPPNPTTQLEEARRRLEDEKRRMMKSQSFAGATTKDRKNMPPPSYAPPRSLPLTAKSIPCANASMDLSGADESHSSSSSRSDRKSYSSKKVVVSSSAPTTPATSDVTVVGYYFCGEPIPYRSTVPGRTVTLAQFKSLITKKGNYKYFFKKASDEFDSGVILEEVTNDNDELPLWEGKVVGKVEKVE